MSRRATERAEALIAEFSIRDPRDIDVTALAFEAGLRVVSAPLDGCEATLAGVGNNAIATIRPSKYRGRERFSIGHEFGHWELHRGRSFRCRVDDLGDNLASNKEYEKEADTFASHLLMPSVLFYPAVKVLGNPGFPQLEELGEQFQTSLLATTIRLTRSNKVPVIAACYRPEGLKWWSASEDVPSRWWLKQELDEDSFAYDLLAGNGKTRPFGKQSADAWFTNDDADAYEVMEHCIMAFGGGVLVLLYLEQAMLAAQYDPNVGNRKYTASGSYVTRRR